MNGRRNYTFGISLLFVLVLFAACLSEEAPIIRRISKGTSSANSEKQKEKNQEIPMDERAFTWKGMIKGSIPVFIHFTEKDSVLSGEITYLNTKTKKPIRILGEILPNNFYHILEFDNDALITGIMSLTKKGKELTGTWFVSGNEDSFKMKMVRSDSVVRKQDLSVKHLDVFGTYSYNYTKNEGNTGYFTVKKKSSSLSRFEILGVHSAPGYNIASIEETDISFPTGATDFKFLVPEDKECDFQVKFYKDFAVVRYINGYCTGYFGHNASVEGIFMKLKKR